MRQFTCVLGLHTPGRQCMYCGRQLEFTPLPEFRVQSTCALDDETNWWAPNAACSAAMLRSSGFQIVAHPEEKIFLCKRVEIPQGPDGPRGVYPARSL